VVVEGWLQYGLHLRRFQFTLPGPTTGFYLGRLHDQQHLPGNLLVCSFPLQESVCRWRLLQKFRMSTTNAIGRTAHIRESNPFLSQPRQLMP